MSEEKTQREENLEHALKNVRRSLENHGGNINKHDFEGNLIFYITQVLDDKSEYLN